MDSNGTDIGALLREKREQLGYSLEDVAKLTRIRLPFIKFIENNQFSELPGGTYLTGFVKIYSRCLQMDVDMVLAKLAELQNEVTNDQEEAAKKGGNDPGDLSREKSSPYKKVIVLFVIAIIAACYYLFVDENQVVVTSVDESPSSILASKNTTENSARLTTSPPSNTEAPMNLQEQSSESVIDETHGKMLMPVISSTGSALRMLALGKGSLIINIDDRLLQTYPLNPGLDLKWLVTDFVKVELSEQNIVRFWLDGEEVPIVDKREFSLQKDSKEE